MSTVSIPRLPSIPGEVETYFDLQPITGEVACPRCDCVWIQPGHRLDLDRLCPQCERADAEQEARKLIADARDLARGEGIFAVLFASDRRMLLRELRTKTFVPPAAAVIPVMRVVGDGCCDQPLGEPSTPADAPPPDVRAAIEAWCDVQDHAAATDEPSDEESDDGSDIGDRFEFH